MAKLYFRHGAVGSAKTLNLLAVAHNYRQQGKEVLLMRPKMDVRFGEDNIRSRAGLEVKADLLIDECTNLFDLDLENINCILVDEAQFISGWFAEHLREVTYQKQIPVICYGLRTDFRTHFFEGSSRLMELADSIEEIKTTCHFCNKKAIFNLKHVNGKATLDGPSVELGCEEKYFPVCHSCYKEAFLETPVSSNCY